ncbi:hypothetical protein SAMN05443551_2431 [Marivita hallyeonensis]|uniref:Uncharacterized protein n=1 Tax=Marivita hallyeonensis TaxID=996342 RepID=A0A1M5TZS0_9RHOB|nr:hypothetical protein SAMN05443551_2431 [Marivita hallyeonensis]
MTVGAIIALVAWACLGTLFVCWSVARSLPVPDGALLFTRFVFWWSISAFVAWAVYLAASLVLAPAGLLNQLMNTSQGLFVLAGALPVIVGLAYGIYLQAFAGHRSRMDP